MADKVFVDRIHRDATPWDTLQRLAYEMGWWLTEPTPGVIAAVPPVPKVGGKSQGALMVAESVAPLGREDETRAEYLARLCEAAGLRFENRTEA